MRPRRPSAIHGQSLAQAAPRLARDLGRSHFRVTVFDTGHRLLAASTPAHAGTSLAQRLGALVGIGRVRVPIRGGTIVIAADFDRFGRLLLWYWSIMLPAGFLAVLIAWLIGRRITARAVGPLRNVTEALNFIASGQMSPQRLIAGGDELRELTSAYNDVAYRLSTETLQRQQTEMQMRQFIADAGHELRTPLTVIMGYLDLLRRGGVTGEAGTRQAYESMLEESRRMRTLVEKLMLLARLERPVSGANVGAVDLSDVMRRVAGSLTPLSGDRLHLADGTPPVAVVADESELYEAIKNIVDNALKYAPQSAVELDVKQDGDSACAVITDRGPGMDPQDLAHAFDRFYRGAARVEAEGSGLGLSIAKLAVERAGGTITIDSTPGSGTSVALCLPLAS